MMKRLIILVFALTLAACSGVGVDTQSKDNAAVATQFLSLVLTEPDQAAMLIHDDFHFEVMGHLPIGAQGMHPIRQGYDKASYFSDFLGTVGALLPDGIVVNPREVIAQGARVAVTVSGEGQGPYGPYNNEYVFVFTFKNGKIVELREYLSDVLVLESLYGASIVPNAMRNDYLVEYFWHDEGPNFSSESLAEAVAYWNTLVDGVDCAMNGAYLLTPREEMDEFDFLWMISWSSQEERATCLESWQAEAMAQWIEATNGIFSFEGAESGYLFATEFAKTPAMWSESTSFVHSYFFCDFNAGMDEKDLYNYQASVNELTGFSENHWYVMLEPIDASEEESSDFIWLDIWASEDQRQSDLEKWANTDLINEATALAKCGDGLEGFTFDGQVIR